MNPSEVIRIVDTIHRERNIPKDVVFEGIETALVSALRKHYDEEAEIEVNIDQASGEITAQLEHEQLSFEEIVGRIGAQTAKQVMIQKIREAERDSLFDEYTAELGQLVTGIVQRYDGGTATVSLNNTESILPRSEQIPGETHHANERVRATICEVRKQGSRVKIILSRIRAELVQRLFEQEIPEIADGVIEIRAIAREPGYRTKVAVSSTDQRVDCVGACVGVRGNRIKNIVDELAGERIDIVRWSDDMEDLIPNALQPAEVDEVILCRMLGRAIVLVREDQLSLAIGRRGQNVRLGSKLCGWDIEIMTREELDDSIEAAVTGYSSLEGVSEELSERLVGEGFLSYDDLSIIETEDLMEMGGLTEEQVEAVRELAEVKAEEAERAEAERRRQEREQQRLAEAAAAAEAEAAAQAEAAEDTAESETTAEVAEEPADAAADAGMSEEVAEAPANGQPESSDAAADGDGQPAAIQPEELEPEAVEDQSAESPDDATRRGGDGTGETT